MVMPVWNEESSWNCHVALDRYKSHGIFTFPLCEFDPTENPYVKEFDLTHLVLMGHSSGRGRPALIWTGPRLCGTTFHIGSYRLDKDRLPPVYLNALVADLPPRVLRVDNYTTWLPQDRGVEVVNDVPTLKTSIGRIIPVY